MYYVSEGPRHGGGEDGDREEDEVENGDRGEVAEPHASSVQPGGVWVGDGCSRHDLHHCFFLSLASGNLEQNC